MLIGVSNIIKPSSSSASISASSASTKIGGLIEQLGINKASIKSCIIGISKLPFHYLDHNIAHAALFLSEVKHNKLIEKKEGILVEFGYYPPEKVEEKRKEEEYMKNGQVIYRYGWELGGLRYYTNNYENFKNNFCDVGMIKLNIFKDNYMTFSTFINEIATKSENKWIKSKYNWANFNCQNFIAESIDILKPNYDKNIIKGNNVKVDEKNIEDIIPNIIKKKLKIYEDE